MKRMDQTDISYVICSGICGFAYVFEKIALAMCWGDKTYHSRGPTGLWRYNKFSQDLILPLKHIILDDAALKRLLFLHGGKGYGCIKTVS